MYPSKRNVFLACLIFLLAASGCNYPGVAAPTPFTFPTPDLTSTAASVATAVVSSPTAVAQLPTATATLPVFQSPTPLPEIQATATLPSLPTTVFIPTATNPPPPPTKTSAPTRVSFEGPGSRPGPSMSATFLFQPPTIDGSFEEWNLERYDVSDPAAGNSNRNGDTDLSGNVMLGWDEQRLYLAARVKDDVYVQNAAGENIFKGDSLEILMDKDVPGDYYQQALSRDDFQLGITPGSPEPGGNGYGYLWFPQAYAGVITQVKVGAMRVGDVYRVEASIPWALFGIDPRRGAHYGFAVSISDNDRGSENVQQSMVSSVPGRVLTDPTTWGDLTLVRTAAPPPPPTNTLVPTLPPPPTNTGVPTLPPPPTNTPSPTPTTGPVPIQRPGASIEALFVGLGPTLDSNLSEWLLPQYPVNKVVYGGERWSGAADLSGQVMVSWDNNNLYLGVQVFDGNYVQGTTGENIFLGDSLEILMDANLGADYYQRSLSGDDFQLGISPGRTSPGDNPQAYLWFPQGQAGRRTDVAVAAAPTADGYIVEAAIPWSVFGITPGVGQHYGFAFSISDNDNQDRAVQQSMVSNVATRVLTDPTAWGDLTLSRH